MKWFRRRKFLVHGDLQVRLIAASLGYVAFYIAVMAIATFVPLAIEMRSANPDDHRTYLLANSFLYLHRHIWPIALGVLAIVSLHSLLLSHRIAGPIYRFRQIFLALSAGRIPAPQRLREGDYLKSEMQLINEMLDSLRTRITAIQDQQDAVSHCIADIGRRSEKLSDHELASLVEKLDTHAKRLAEQVARVEKQS